ncbi:hypothetical protein LIER_23260 [Lithospermum erythrorhizon]|uniref:Uncharacterized protein n=1 Tax=Lithospermum erythrorhizon TaxID=34254 RepID=A0AAV3R015_LITER
MGKKKTVKKTKELSVAIAESSSIMGQQLDQPQETPRKRGRPRKNMLQQDVKNEEDGTEIYNKKAKKTSEEQEEDEQNEVKAEAEEVAPKNIEMSSKQQAPRSKAKRKNKPRKSS